MLMQLCLFWIIQKINPLLAITGSNSKLDFQQCEMRHIVLDWAKNDRYPPFCFNGNVKKSFPVTLKTSRSIKGKSLLLALIPGFGQR